MVNSKYVKTAVIVIVVIFVIFIIYKLYKKYVADSEQTWPEDISDCPDYWTNLGNGKCKNSQNLGTCTRGQVQPVVTFGKRYKGEQGNKKSSMGVITNVFIYLLILFVNVKLKKKK